MKYFKTIFNGIDWNLLTQTLSTNDPYDIFYKDLKIQIKQRNLSCSWVSKGLRKLSKGQLRLYDKKFQNRQVIKTTKHKIYKNMLEKLKIQSKKL